MSFLEPDTSQNQTEGKFGTWTFYTNIPEEINFTFDDVKEIVATERILLCANREELKVSEREFTKKRIYSKTETKAKDTKDEGYCSYWYDLNRHSGKLETTKIENYEGIVVIQNGIFNCELAKQKF